MAYCSNFVWLDIGGAFFFFLGCAAVMLLLFVRAGGTRQGTRPFQVPVPVVDRGRRVSSSRQVHGGGASVSRQDDQSHSRKRHQKRESDRDVVQYAVYFAMSFRFMRLGAPFTKSLMRSCAEDIGSAGCIPLRRNVTALNIAAAAGQTMRHLIPRTLLTGSMKAQSHIAACWNNHFRLLAPASTALRLCMHV